MSQATLKNWVILALVAIFSGCGSAEEPAPVAQQSSVVAPAPAAPTSFKTDAAAVAITSQPTDLLQPPTIGGGPVTPFAPATNAPATGWSPAAPRQMQFIQGYQQGFEIAAREGKPMLVFFTAEWCKYCHQMAAEVFADSQVTGLADRFVCVMVDGDAEPQVCQYYRVRFPTLLFVAPTGQQLHRMVGKRPSHEVVHGMQSALQSMTRMNGGVPVAAVRGESR